MLGTAFLEVVSMLRSELGRHDSPAVGLDDLPRLKQSINRAYEHLYVRYDWPHLQKVFTRFALAAGDRYYNLPTGLRHDGIIRVEVWWSNLSTPVKRGIGPEHYNGYDSVSDERSSPVSHYDLRYSGAAAPQIEVWPMPSDNVQELEIYGKLAIDRLVNDTDLLLLDDQLVVLQAKRAFAKNRDELVAIQADIEDYLGFLRAEARGDEPTVAMGMGCPEDEQPVNVIVRVSG
jgi:hypothetical protein